jgi:hypothetical protein
MLGLTDKTAVPLQRLIGCFQSDWSSWLVLETLSLCVR